MYGKDIARKAIAKLMEEKSAALSDSTPDKVKSRSLISPGLKAIEKEITGEELPSEIRAIAKRIEAKRLSAPGISREESHSLIARIGLKHRAGR